MAENTSNSPEDRDTGSPSSLGAADGKFPSIGGGAAYVAREHELLSKLSNLFKDRILASEVSLGDAVVRVPASEILNFAKEIKGHPGLAFEMLLSVTAIDWMDKREDRFDVVYHFLSIQHSHRLRVVCSVPEECPEVYSLTSVWLSADFLESECWDMYGIVFKGHPNLRRILMYDEFQGFPLRKDYPVQGKQPRIKLIAPEVRNTAVDMTREPLVAIRKRQKPNVASRADAS